MSASHICATCRRDALAKLRHKGARQLRSTSSFVSLITPQTKKDGKARENNRGTRTADSFEGDHSVAIRSIKYGTRGKRLSYSGLRTRSEYLESLFEEGRTAQNTTIQLANPTPKAASIELYAHVETLKKLLEDDNQPLADVWQFFVTHLGPEVWVSNGSPILRPLAFNPVTADLIQKLKAARQRSQAAVGLPTITEILGVYKSLGIFRPLDWNALVFDSLHKLSEELKAGTQIDDPSENLEGSPPSPPRVVRIYEDILEAWNLLCIHYRLHNENSDSKGNGSASDWSFLRPPPIQDLKQSIIKGGLDSIFLTLVPRYPQYHARTITSAAITSFALLTDDALAQHWCDNRSHPFVIIMADLLAGTSSYVKASDIKDMEHTMKSFNLDLRSLFQRAHEISRSSKGLSVHIRTCHPPSSFNAKLLRRQLSKAMADRDLKEVNRLWAQARLSATESKEVAQDGILDAPPTIPDLVSPTVQEEKHEALSQDPCNQFIMTYMGLRQQSRAIDVWNFMIQTGLPPTLRTWNAMLEGCKLARNHIALEGVWAKLQASGTQPDMACWTTRIGGLIECGKPDLGIRALHWMGRVWTETAKKHNIEDLKSAGDIGKTVKPTVEIVNAAISGLLRRRQNDSAQRILAWGGTFGITPDIITFNTLLRAFIRDGRDDAVPELLRQMQKQGIQADVATFTTILDEMFKSSDPKSLEEQSEIINLIFSEMEAAGVQANPRTYGKIIYSLLEHKPKDLTAVHNVMTRMAAERHEPSTYIYTMLVRYHFSDDPPDLDAVRFLLERIRQSGAVMDHVFWDRVIEGYVGVGDTATALQILGKEDREGARVGWPALEMLVSTLWKKSEWDLAREVVRNVRMDRGGPPDPDERGIDGQHSFWRTMAGMGLIDVE